MDIPASPPGANTAAAAKPIIPVPALLLAMLHVSNRVSDLFFSGELTPRRGERPVGSGESPRVTGTSP